MGLTSSTGGGSTVHWVVPVITVTLVGPSVRWISAALPQASELAISSALGFTKAGGLSSACDGLVAEDVRGWMQWTCVPEDLDGDERAVFVSRGFQPEAGLRDVFDNLGEQRPNRLEVYRRTGPGTFELRWQSPTTDFFADTVQPSQYEQISRRIAARGVFS